MSKTEWRNTGKHDMYESLKEGVRGQVLDVEGNWYDVTCDREIYLCWPSGRRVEVISNRQYRIEVKPAEPEYVDMDKSLERLEELTHAGRIADICADTVFFMARSYRDRLEVFEHNAKLVAEVERLEARVKELEAELGRRVDG